MDCGINCILSHSLLENSSLDVDTLCRVYCVECGKVYADSVPFSTAARMVQAQTNVNLQLHHELNAALMVATEGKPCRVIDINGEHYLERYYMGDVPDADGVLCQWWLHRFLRSDAERHLHTHSWIARAVVLTGWYLEMFGSGSYRVRAPGSFNYITFETLHRVAAVMPNTWTSLLVRPKRRETWEFVGDDGQRVTMRSGGVDWWKDCEPRRGDVDGAKICTNCDTAMPNGCGGAFKHDPECWLNTEPLIGWDDGVTIGGERVCRSEVPAFPGRVETELFIGGKSARQVMNLRLHDAGATVQQAAEGLREFGRAAMGMAGNPTGFVRVGHEDDGEVEP